MQMATYRLIPWFSAETPLTFLGSSLLECECIYLYPQIVFLENKCN